MKKWSVIVSSTVRDLIAEQVLHIAERSIDNAMAWEARLDAAIFGLSEIAGYAVDEDASDRLGYTVRKLVFEGTYLVHYRVDEPAGVIRVVGFRHGARLPRRNEP